MREAYFSCLYDIFSEDENVVFITADTGCTALDKIANAFPGRFFNVGIAEQQMIGMAAGLALEGFTVYCYAISPFITSRCYEFTKLDVCVNNLPVHLVGLGSALTYTAMGPTHHSTEDIGIMRVLPNMSVYSPINIETVAPLARYVHYRNCPSYTRLEKSGLHLYDRTSEGRLEDGFCLVSAGRSDVCVITTGLLAKSVVGKDYGHIDMFRLWPVRAEKLVAILSNYRAVITLEETLLPGGLGSIISELFCDYGVSTQLIRKGLTDFIHGWCSRDNIWSERCLGV